MQKQKKTNIKLTNEEHNTLIHKHKTTQPVKLIMKRSYDLIDLVGETGGGGGG